MKSIIKYVILVILLSSCGSWKSRLYKTGTIDEARLNAILDFTNTQKMYKDDRFIMVLDYEETSDLYCFSIFSEFQFMAELVDTIGVAPRYFFPTKYKEVDNKLFLWEDYSTIISNELIDKIHQYNVIDSTYYNIRDGRLPKDYLVTQTIDDSKQSVKYFICKKNLSIYRKVIDNKFYPKKKYPNINCEATNK